jgi:glycosyltransferase involved in cell wall biosynthesis
VSTPAITVVTAVHNGADFLTEAVRSIRAQTVDDWEYILVDDASSDATPEILASLAIEDRRIRYIRREHCEGPYVAANDGLREARGKWVARIDADDLCDPVRFERQIAYLENHPHLRACATGWEGIDEHGQVVYKPVMPSRPRTLKWHLCLRWTPAHSSAFVELDALKEDPNLKVLTFPNPRNYMLEMNTKIPPFDKKEVRQAVCYAVPYESIIKDVFHGYAQPNRSIVGNGMPSSDISFWKYDTDVKKAADLLTRAGFPNGEGAPELVPGEALPALPVWGAAGIPLEHPTVETFLEALRDEAPAPGWTDDLGLSLRALELMAHFQSG